MKNKKQNQKTKKKNKIGQINTYPFRKWWTRKYRDVTVLLHTSNFTIARSTLALLSM